MMGFTMEVVDTPHVPATLFITTNTLEEFSGPSSLDINNNPCVGCAASHKL